MIPRLLLVISEESWDFECEQMRRIGIFQRILQNFRIEVMHKPSNSPVSSSCYVILLRIIFMPTAVQSMFTITLCRCIVTCKNENEIHMVLLCFLCAHLRKCEVSTGVVWGGMGQYFQNKCERVVVGVEIRVHTHAGLSSGRLCDQYIFYCWSW